MNASKREDVTYLAMDRVSREYAERIDELNGLRVRLDRIGEILMLYGEDPRRPLELDDLKEMLELAEHHRPRRTGT